MLIRRESPFRSTSIRKTPSANGDRQILPMQTKSTFTTGSFSTERSLSEPTSVRRNLLHAHISARSVEIDKEVGGGSATIAMHLASCSQFIQGAVRLPGGALSVAAHVPK